MPGVAVSKLACSVVGRVVGGRGVVGGVVAGRGGKHQFNSKLEITIPRLFKM